ncbi:MAG: serine/threonine-protein kinase [Myxococcota bacterium]|nr:serine/threonine-protein kinase [Myxococcota bacterium]
MPKHSLPLFDSSIPPEERYDIIGRIASGGMAEIYLAKMLTTAGVEREVVLKRLLPELQSDHEFVQMFHDEARIASQLHHPNVVQIFELGELDGSLFISMEHLRGVNLRDLLARLHHDSRKLPTELACRICCGALRGLGYGHEFTDENGRRQNIIHRDVSPQNIIVTYDGIVKMVDFGVAKAEGKLHQTRAGLVKGKFAYMSPEQVHGRGLDGRSDTFALAEVTYELLLHRHPFFAQSDMEVLNLILNSDPPHPTSLDQNFPPQLADILLKALRKDPGRRFADAREFEDSIEQFLISNRTPATDVSLARFVRELFNDRMSLEQKARETGDEDLLVKAMTVGRAERWEITGTALPQQDPVPQPYVASDYINEDPTNDQFSSRELIERANNPIVAAEPVDPFVSDREFVQEPEDPSEARTMMGTFSESELAEIRQAGQSLQNVVVSSVEEEPTRESEVNDEDPTLFGTRRDELKQTAPVAAATPAKGASNSQSQERDRGNARPISMPIGRPVGSIPPPPASAPPARKPKPSITPPPNKRASSVKAQRKDQLGIWLFVFGLGALIGALVYAGILIYGNSSSLHLVIRSEPKGAEIWLDGIDTGLTTPGEMSDISADKSTRIELKHSGYKTYVRIIEPDPDNRGEPYVINKILEPTAAKRPTTTKETSE